jgi:hypothetical protein
MSVEFNREVDTDLVNSTVEFGRIINVREKGLKNTEILKAALRAFGLKVNEENIISLSALIESGFSGNEATCCQVLIELGFDKEE